MLETAELEIVQAHHKWKMLRIEVTSDKKLNHKIVRRQTHTNFLETASHVKFTEKK